MYIYTICNIFIIYIICIYIYIYIHTQKMRNLCDNPGWLSNPTVSTVSVLLHNYHTSQL